MKKTDKIDKKYIYLGIAIILIIAIFLLNHCQTEGRTRDGAGTELNDSARMPMLVHRIQKCSRLYSIAYKVHKIITHEDQKMFKLGSLKFNIPLTDRHIAIPFNATVKAYVDMANFSEQNIQTTGKRIIITLPEPKIEVTDTYVDHEKTKTHVSWIRSNYTAEEQENFYRQGLVSITNNVMNAGILENARLSATRTLVPIITQMGYTEENIQIRFGKTEYNLDELPKLIDSKTTNFE
ncbi:MAG: DUF4230 domain-containing protein [Bacteroidaceae bacterium]|nr:DUF4230 domain-containing protein [Bacteroidaceae bacterium]